LIKWKLFGKNKKNKQENTIEINNNISDKEKISDEHNEEVIEEKNDFEDQEIKEYNQTLYTCDDPSYKKNEQERRIRWESPSTIEKNVDEIDKNREIYKKTTAGSDRLERKVDDLLRCKKISGSKKKK